MAKKSNGDGVWLVKMLIVVIVLGAMFWYGTKWEKEGTEKYKEPCMVFCQQKKALYSSNYGSKCVCKICEYVEIESATYENCDYMDFYLHKAQKGDD